MEFLLKFKNEIESKILQQFLFERGCEWRCGGKDILTRDTYGNSSIFCIKNKDITSGTEGYFDEMEEYKSWKRYDINDLAEIDCVLNGNKMIFDIQKIISDLPEAKQKQIISFIENYKKS